MFVEPTKDQGLIVIPENHFERVYLQSFLNCDRECYLKHSPTGLSDDDVMGLKIKKIVKESDFGEKVHQVMHDTKE